MIVSGGQHGLLLGLGPVTAGPLLALWAVSVTTTEVPGLGMHTSITSQLEATHRRRSTLLDVLTDTPAATIQGML